MTWHSSPATCHCGGMVGGGGGGGALLHSRFAIYVYQCLQLGNVLND